MLTPIRRKNATTIDTLKRSSYKTWSESHLECRMLCDLRQMAGNPAGYVNLEGGTPHWLQTGPDHCVWDECNQSDSEPQWPPPLWWDNGGREAFTGVSPSAVCLPLPGPIRLATTTQRHEEGRHEHRFLMLGLMLTCLSRAASLATDRWRCGQVSSKT
jgi:hypothetical protein